MSYFEYSDYETAPRVVAFLGYVMICGFISYTIYMISSYSITVLLCSILFFAIIYLLVYLYKKRRLYGVFLYDNYMEISGFKEFDLIKYSDIVDCCYFGDSRNEPLLSHHRFSARGLGGLIVYSLLMFFRSFDKEKGYFTGGNSKDCVRITIKYGDKEYVVLFSLKDNYTFLEELQNKMK